MNNCDSKPPAFFLSFKNSARWLLLASLSLFAAHEINAQSIPDGRYTITSRHSGLVMQVDASSTANGANVNQWAYQNAAHQQFTITSVGGGYYSIRPVHSGASLDVYDFSTEPGGEIRQWSYWGGANQQWQIVSAGSGYHKIISRHSGLALDVWNWSSANGGDIRQWTDTGGNNQQWRLQLVNASSSSSSSSASSSPAGLAARPDNTTCLASNFAESTAVQLQRVLPELTFSSPVFYLPHPTLNNIDYVVQQRGIIYRVDRNNGTRQQLVNLNDFYTLDNTCGECGLLGMAFDPDFADNGYIYLSFTQGLRNDDLTSFVARFVSNDNGTSLARTGNTLDRIDLISAAQPYDNHNGGHIAFGPDGYLYVGLGDGGSGNDPQNNAQNIDNLLGAMLRITATGAPAPGNNVPGALPEIYAYGLRNPWRWSFDRETGALWLGDVGQSALEEINIIEAGGNYGWRCYEGDRRTNNSCTTSGPYVAPVATYGRTEGVSVTGGYVYRGTALPALYGAYIFGDFGSGRIWALFSDGNGNYQRELLLASGRSISSFAEGRDGELYVVDHSGGIYQIVADNSIGSGPPQQLTDTGCVNTANPTQPAAGLIPYTVNEPFWSDGAEKTRYLALPNNQRITVATDGDFNFPVNTVLMKNFRLQDRLIETRLFMRGENGTWRGYTYRWNANQTQAMLLPDALDEEIGSLTWHYPSRAECNVCHTAVAGFTLGPESAQLNGEFTYPSTAITANQLHTWETIGLFAAPLTTAQRNAFLPPSDDTQYSLTQRARSYLHSNCSNCHRPQGPTQVSLDLRYTTSLAQTGACNTVPTTADLGIPNARVIAPGASERSVLLQRMIVVNDNRMPPISSHVVDEAGTELIAEWINTLGGCQ
ncbi:PQQ-dependent sugar dehydrogenase [Cellvibrio sp. ARAG 10.3]|uniref:PQQ-dependent sugar dehydrogenase n=1 Tax=Cellvibrio sp. ARAG 10.3 TaxID=3451358 RepID=UPI003F47E3E3